MTAGRGRDALWDSGVLAALMLTLPQLGVGDAHALGADDVAQAAGDLAALGAAVRVAGSGA